MRDLFLEIRKILYDTLLNIIGKLKVIFFLKKGIQNFMGINFLIF